MAKKFLIVGAIFVLLVLAIVVDTQAKNPSINTLQVEGLVLNEQYVLLRVDSSEVLLASVYPFNANNQKVLWHSENPLVASVVDGVITGHSRGATKVFATTQEGGYSVYCFVDVVY